MALNENIPIDGDGVSTGTLVSQICAAIRALRTAINAGGVDKIQDDDGDTGFWTEETADKDEIQGKVANVEAFRIHDNGILSLDKQSKARGYHSGADQVIPTAIYTKIQLNAETYDSQNEFDSTTNYRFTAKEAGTYAVMGQVYYLNDADSYRMILALYKGGANWINCDVIKHAGSFISLLQCDCVELDANDFLELWTFHLRGVDASVRPLSARTFLTINKLS